MRRRDLRTQGAAALLLLLLVGCGRTHVIPEGTLEIRNECGSCSTISYVEIREVGCPNYLAYDVWARPGDSIVLDVFPSLYDVSVHWADGGLAVYWGVEVFEDCETKVYAHR